MKKLFKKADVEIIRLPKSDIVTASGGCPLGGCTGDATPGTCTGGEGHR